MLSIKRELLRRELNAETGLAINACPLIMQDGGVTIDPKGLIYKCNSLVGYPEFSIGNVQNNGFVMNGVNVLIVNKQENVQIRTVVEQELQSQKE